jgi:glycosyltransferase involved in cell wall biosynthesis
MGLVSALVCTRNRPESLVRTVRSLLAGDAADVELFVIDQSDGPETQQALAGFHADTRLHYVHSCVRGKGAALNEGLRLARGHVVVCTDDDCEAPLGWISNMARALEAQRTAAILFCNVVAGDHDPALGYVPSFERHRDRLLRSIAAFRAGFGLGAGMALRRDVIMELGGFDESFGPGARFPSGDDWDISQRVLLRRWHVYEAADIAITHHGFRSLVDGRDHARRDWLAIGALCAKPIRSGHFSAALISLSYFVSYAVWPPVHDVIRCRRPSGLARIAGFMSGFGQGLRTPVDRTTLLFQPRSSTAPWEAVATTHERER